MSISSLLCMWKIFKYESTFFDNNTSEISGDTFYFLISYADPYVITKILEHVFFPICATKRLD